MTLLDKAETVEEMTQGRIPFDRAVWLVQAIENGTTIRQEVEREARERGIILSEEEIQYLETGGE